MQNPDVSIIKYNAGNIQSVIFSLERLGATYELTDDPEKLKSAKRIIFPGVGEAGSAMRSLKESGLDLIIPTLTQPFLGTCVGMQLLCNHSEESDTTCLGVFNVEIKKFPRTPGFKVPHTGWNSLEKLNDPLFNDLKESDYVYYNHGYYAPLCQHTIAETNHIFNFSAALRKDNFWACQFHSELSSKVGSQLFKNFLTL
jgi:imidazole glycerol-phosphate synthase subunit HisH